MSRSSNEDPTASVAMLGGGSGQDFRENSFVAAGNDAISTSNDVNVTARNITIIRIGQTTPPSSAIVAMGQWKRIFRSRLGFVQQVLSVFQSAENSDALRHGSQTQRILDILPPEQAAGHGDSDVQEATNADHDSSEPPQPDHHSSPPPRSSISNPRQFHVTSIEDVSPQSNQFRNSTNAEIYIRSMLESSGHHGLPCWSPKPREPLVKGKGVVPGDVGIFSAGSGFEKLFNIWDEDHLQSLVAAGSTHQIPSRALRTQADPELTEGETLHHGATSLIHKTPDGRTSSYEFRCYKEPGAILVCTSDADLEQLVDRVALREFIIQHAGLIYQHADSFQRVDESLYIISGCIKSHSWAIAAYKDMAQAPYDELRLMKQAIPSEPGGSLSDYYWSHRATAEARFGTNRTSQSTLGNHGKDQALFLRGFKLALSDDLRSKLRASSSKTDSNHGSGARFDFKPQDETGGDATDRPGHDGSGGSGGHNAQGGSFGHSVAGSNFCLNPDSVQVEPFPTAEKMIHPCDEITGLLLEATGADCALSHDDDWRLSLRGSPWTDNSCVEIAMSSRLCVRNGIAYLENKPDSELQFPATTSADEKDLLGLDSSGCGASHSVMDSLQADTQNNPTSNSRSLPKLHRAFGPYGAAKDAEANPEPSVTGPPLSPSDPPGTDPVAYSSMSHPLRGSSSEQKEDNPPVIDAHHWEGGFSSDFFTDRETPSDWNFLREISPCDQLFANVDPGDLIIVVMGMTGSGKSTFINRFCNIEGLMSVNHSLRSGTGEIEGAVLTLPSTHQVHPNRRLVFVEMPGFDETDHGEYEVLRRIGVWLASVHIMRVKIAGFVYLYNIGINRMCGSSLLSHDIFRSICGPTALKAAVLASTQWETILHNPAAGAIREKDFKQVWSDTLKQGAVYRRIDVDDPRRDTLDVIDYILRRHAGVIAQIQEELVDMNKRVAETEAGLKIREMLWSWLGNPHTQDLSQEEESKEFSVEPGFVDKVKGLLRLKTRPDLTRDRRP